MSKVGGDGVNKNYVNVEGLKRVYMPKEQREHMEKMLKEAEVGQNADSVQALNKGVENTTDI